jgi:hypothetical protein
VLGFFRLLHINGTMTMNQATSDLRVPKPGDCDGVVKGRKMIAALVFMASGYADTSLRWTLPSDIQMPTIMSTIVW